MCSIFGHTFVERSRSWTGHFVLVCSGCGKVVNGGPPIPAPHRDDSEKLVRERSEAA